MERKIGEIFGENPKLEVVKTEKLTCIGCFYTIYNCSELFEHTGDCSYMTRTDKKSVIFKEVKE